LTRQNTSANESSIASEGSKDSVTLNIKLFAVSDTRQKLIGLVNIPIDWKGHNRVKMMDREEVTFSKCIDTKAFICFSLSMDEFESSYESSRRDKLERVVKTIRHSIN
jgi:hypothetical protein